MSFNELGLAEPLLKAIAETGYETPTPIQQQAIPAVLASGSHDLARQTGSPTYVTGVAAMGVHIKAMRWVVN